MNLMDVGGYKNANVVNPRKGYQKPFVVITPIIDHRDGHYVRPNKVALKYLDFKRDVDLNFHVKVFNFVTKTNAETFEKYIINAFSYMLRNIALN
jgi:hypothetical protein